MQDRFQHDFSDRARQSEAAKLANLEAFRAVLAPISQGNVDTNKVSTMSSVVATASLDSKVSSRSKPLLRFVPKRVRTPLLAATAGFAALGAVACASGSNTEVPQEPANQGQVLGENVTPAPSVSVEFTTPGKTEYRQAPDFTLKDKNGNPVSMHFGGRSAIVLYSGTGACPPCRRESKKIAEIREKYASQGLAVLHITREYDPNYGEDMTVLLDPQQEVAQKYDMLLANPGTVFIRDGKIVYRYFGYNDENSDFDQLAAALMAGKDLEGILPTATPAPTFTPLPTRAPESEQSDSAEVIDLGNFDLGVVGWQEYTNVMPNTRGSSDGRSVGAYTKHVVVKAIARNKTDKWQELTGLRANYTDNTSFELDDKFGNQLNYGPGSIPVVEDVIIPLDYEGVFKDPFVMYIRDGTYRSLDYLYQPDRPLSKLIPPGFGIPVFIDYEIPVQVNDYNLKFEAVYQGKKDTKVIKKGQKADNFGLIAPDVVISPQSENLDAKMKDVGDYSIKVLGSTKGNLVPGTAPHDLLLFDVTNKMPLEKYPFGLSIGLVYLKDGRVVSLERGSPKVAANTETVVGIYMGTADPHKDFSHTAIEDIDRTFDFDLKGAVLVLGVLGQWKAWEIPEGANVPVGQGGE